MIAASSIADVAFEPASTEKVRSTDPAVTCRLVREHGALLSAAKAATRASR